MMAAACSGNLTDRTRGQASFGVAVHFCAVSHQLLSSAKHPLTKSSFDWLFDLFVNSHFIELWAELFEFEPLYGIPAIFFSRITGDARETLLRIGHRSAFSALEGDNDPSSLILGHERLIRV